MTEKKYTHTVGKYLGRIIASSELLRKTEDELLQLPVFAMPLFELIYTSTVAGVEKYLEDRLRVEVFLNDESIEKYIDCNNNLRERYHAYRSKWNPKLWNRELKNLSSPFSEDDKGKIQDNLNRIVYHRLDLLDTYLHYVSGFTPEVCPSWELVKPVIDTRQRILHHGSTNDDGTPLGLTISDVVRACEVAESFISEVENFFVSIGHPEVFEDPSEE